ncbi:MAG: ankyrin repeat domain-containing protein [Planctomycetota bacterium]
MQINWAARRGDNSTLERHLKRDVSADALNGALRFAAEGRQAGLSTLQLLIDRGADVNAVSNPGEETPLILAAKGGQHEKVQFLIASGADPKFVTASGYTPITSLTYFNTEAHNATLEVLLQAGVHPDTQSDCGESALEFAVRGGNFEAIRLLLQHGANRELVTANPVFWAIALGTAQDVAEALHSKSGYRDAECWLLSVRTGDIAKSEIMLADGAYLHARDRLDCTSLMSAVDGGRADMTRWLLAQGVDVHAANLYRETALTRAAMAGNVDCVRILIEAGASRSNRSDPVMASASNIGVVKTLLDAGLDLNAVNECGRWVLLAAVEEGDTEFVSQLLKIGADPNLSDTREPALLSAAKLDLLEIVSLLLSYGADVNAADVDGCTPLSEAKSVACVDLLLAVGGDVRSQNICGIPVVAQHRDPDIIDRLRSAGAMSELSHDALNKLIFQIAQEGNLDLLNYWLGHNADVNGCAGLNLTPLMAAAERGHLNVIQRLIDVGANVNAREYRGRTALFYAAAPEIGLGFQITQEIQGQSLREILGDMFSELPTETQEMIGDTIVPPYRALYSPSDDVEALDQLLDAGADLEACDEEGLTPFLLACCCGRSARVARLLQRGADRHVQDNTGQCAHDLVQAHHDPEQRDQILQLLAGTWQ